MNPAPSKSTRAARATAGLWLAFSLVTSALAQYSSTDPLNTGPRGLTEVTPSSSATSAANAAAAAAAANAASPGTTGTGGVLSGVPPVLPPGSLGPGGPNGGPGNPAAALGVPGPLPPDPSTTERPVMFGSQIFSGRFGNQPFSGYNPDYMIAVGDRISLRLWGAFSFEATQTVDAQGNIFVPNVGPVKVVGLRNGDLNRQVEAQIKRVFRANVGVYATLEAAQPVKVFVTGFVRAPGLYGGLSSDSVLYYLDKAGGIDPERGSYLEVDVMRNGQSRAKVDLYRFLLEGRIEALQLHDGDTLVAMPRKYTVRVAGEVLNPYIFEFGRSQISGAELVSLARPRPGATHFSIVREIGVDRRSEYHPIAEASAISIQDGDEVTFTSDKYPGTILVRIDGAHLGERMLVLPYGSHLRDALARVRAAPEANIAAAQLFRRSVATRQKELIETSLRSLETYALTARSATSEEAALRQREADSILEYVKRARTIEPRGQIVLGDRASAGNTLLEDGDVIRIPERSNLVLVSGEVLFPNALVYDPQASATQYIDRAGGYTQGADRAKMVVLRQDGSVVEGKSTAPQPGDEIMALPKIETKNVEITRGITQIVYQIAVAARVLFGL